EEEAGDSGQLADKRARREAGVPATPASGQYTCMLGILLRPLRLPEADLTVTQPERMLQAYRQLCTAPGGEEPWSAVARSPADVESFQRGWRRFQEEQEELARVAGRKDLASNEEPSLWLTYQVQRRMADIANDAGK
ncbi:MAG: hypothetical protein VYE14_03885, partial [Verrucomicrobiota bacterium]|nr:hypothetical protein [Verrucomicrobiota bacterium]